MFSEKKTFSVLTIAMNNIGRSFSWLFYSGIGIYMLVFFSVMTHVKKMYETGLEYTCADVFTECMSGYYVYLFFLPVGMFLRQRITGNSEDIQLYLRYGKRSAVWKNNVMYSLIISLIFTVIVIAAVYITALLLCRDKINWGVMNSIYYQSCGNTNESMSFAGTVLISTLFVFITMLSVSIAMQAAEIVSKVLSWILMIAYTGLNLRGPLALCNYNISYQSYNNIRTFLLIQLVKIAFAVIAYFIGRTLIRKKDFYE